MTTVGTTDVKSDLMTPDEAAAYLRVSRMTVYRLVREHKLSALKIGGQWRFRKEFLDAALEPHPAKAKTATPPRRLMAIPRSDDEILGPSAQAEIERRKAALRA
jgi:excisionase family DNA binding protein